MMKRGFGVLMVGAVLGAFFACSTPAYVDGQCNSTDPCHTVTSPKPEGSVCDSSGLCVCPPGTRECCPEGAPSGECRTACLVNEECQGVGECSTDAECAGPPDAACGGGVCVSGKCELMIHEGPLPSQRYADCKRRECNAAGAVVSLDDVSDYYEDMNPCTVDYCTVDGPTNLVLANATPCPGGGYCYKGACVECVQGLAGASCPGSYVCEGKWCVPPNKCGGVCGGVCAPCPPAYPCGSDIDCLSDHCVGGWCQAPTCSDARKNDAETGVDCGGATCPKCPDGQGCKAHEDCLSQVCKAGMCQAPTCFDAVQNGAETGVDCGTQACGPCGPG